MKRTTSAALNLTRQRPLDKEQGLGKSGLCFRYPYTVDRLDTDKSFIHSRMEMRPIGS